MQRVAIICAARDAPSSSAGSYAPDTPPKLAARLCRLCAAGVAANRAAAACGASDDTAIAEAARTVEPLGLRRRKLVRGQTARWRGGSGRRGRSRAASGTDTPAEACSTTEDMLDGAAASPLLPNAESRSALKRCSSGEMERAAEEEAMRGRERDG
jgi:hypothetical protein